MKKETAFLITICAILGGFYYWFSGYALVGGVLMAVSFVQALVLSRRIDGVLLLFFALLPFTGFCLFAALEAPSWIRSGFAALYLLYCLSASTLLQATLQYSRCVAAMIWRRIEIGGLLGLAIFMASALIIPQEALAWIGGFQAETLRRGGLLGLVLLLFLPVLSVPQWASLLLKQKKTKKVFSMSASVRNVVK